MVGSVASFPTLASGYCLRVNDQGEVTGQWQMITSENEAEIIDLLESYDLEVTSINSNGGVYAVGDVIPYWDDIEIIG